MSGCWSGLREAPERGDEDFVRFEEINREVFDAFSVKGEIQIVYDTRVLFGQPKESTPSESV